MSVKRWSSILTLILFFITNLVVIFPFYIPVPVPTALISLIKKSLISCRIIQPSNPPPISTQTPKIHWLHIHVNFQTAPLFSVLLLLATRAINGSIVRQGVVGADGIEPLDIMALFLSLAYLSISLDTTGLFRFLAFWVARRGGSSGRRLHLLLYMFFLALGVVVGNDPVILAGTPFLAYFTRVTGIDPPTAWIFAQFPAANMASAILPPSNPTNLVLTGAFAIHFLTYTAHTVLPVLAAAVCVYPLLALVLFRSPKLVPRHIDIVGLHTAQDDEDQDQGIASMAHGTAQAAALADGAAPHELTDRSGAIFGSVLLAITLAVLVGTSVRRVPVWEVTIPPAVIMIARDIWHDRARWRLPPSSKTSVSASASTSATANDSLKTNGAKSDGAKTDTPGIAAPAAPHRHTASSLLHHVQHTALPTLGAIAPRMPIALFPFALCMFILVQGLAAQGWVEVFAGWWAAWARTCAQSGPGGAVVGAVTLMLILATVLCNFCGTNIGTTILLARVLKSWLDTAATASPPVSPRVRIGAIYALALGSNFGAFSFSFSASLAGLLWRGILRQKGIYVHQRQFALLNLPILAVAVCAAAGVLVAEVFVVVKQ